MKKKTLKWLSLGLTGVLCGVTLPKTASYEGNAVIGDPDYLEEPTESKLWENEFFIGAWCEPSTADDEFQAYKEAGYNVMYLANKMTYNSNTMKAYLDKCLENDLYVVSMCGMNRNAPVSMRSADKNVYDLNDYPNFLGVGAVDEPLGAPVAKNEKNGVYKDFDSIYDYLLDEYKFINENYPNAVAFDSVIANGRYEGDFGYGAMNDWAEKVLKYMDPEDRQVSFDYYPYKVQSKTRERYTASDRFLWRMQLARQAIDKYNSQINYYYYQQEWDSLLREQVSTQEVLYCLYSAMAYGFNSFVAFKYEPYWNIATNEQTFIKSPYGQKTEFWYYNKQAFNEIKKFDHIYLQFTEKNGGDWQGVIFFEGTENTRTANRANADAEVVFMNSYAGITNVSATQDTVVGVMKDKDGRDGYMFTNQSDSLDRLSDKVKATFPGKTRAIVVEKGEWKEVSLNANTLEMNIVPGGGIFVIPLD